jgi:hypothetical protein
MILLHDLFSGDQPLVSQQHETEAQQIEGVVAYSFVVLGLGKQFQRTTGVVASPILVVADPHEFLFFQACSIANDLF